MYNMTQKKHKKGSELLFPFDFFKSQLSKDIIYIHDKIH